MFSKKLSISKCATCASVKLKIMKLTRIQKKSQEVTHSTRDVNILKFSELEFLLNPIDIENSMKTCFQEMNAHIQANEYILADLSINISKVLQILRQSTSSNHQRTVFSISQIFSEFQRSYSYQTTTMSVDISFYSYNPSDNNSYLKRTFDFNNFSKLFREYANHQAHTIIVTNEVHFSTDDTRSYMITIKIKLLSIFPSLTKFLSA